MSTRAQMPGAFMSMLAYELQHNPVPDLRAFPESRVPRFGKGDES